MSGSVLVVDDDVHQRRSLVLGLRIADFRVYEASEGREALQVLDSEAIDLAVVDLMMPGMNGLQLLRRMQFRQPGVGVVLTSGYHLGRSQLERVGLNAVAFVPKPYDLEELTEFLREKIERRSAQFHAPSC